MSPRCRVVVTWAWGLAVLGGCRSREALERDLTDGWTSEVAGEDLPGLDRDRTGDSWTGNSGTDGALPDPVPEAGLDALTGDDVGGDGPGREEAFSQEVLGDGLPGLDGEDPDDGPPRDPGSGEADGGLEDAGAPGETSLTREELRRVVLDCPSEALLEEILERYDGPLCDGDGCTLVTVVPASSVSLRGEFNAWGEMPLTPVACREGAFYGEVGPVPASSDAWQYRLFFQGDWQDDPLNRWIRFTDISINNSMHRPGAPRIARLAAVHSPQLGNVRDVYVYVPAEAFLDPSRRFPVLLLQDGWNVFENPRAPFGSWAVDRTARELAAAGVIEPVVLVGVTTANRIDEYLYTDFWVGGTGTPVQVHPQLPAYADFLVETLLPRLRREFPIRSGPADTGIGGSSLGGISAFWIAWMHAGVFGKVAALSPSFWVGEPGSGTEDRPSIREVVAGSEVTPARRALKIYFDSGDGGYSPGGGEDPAYAWDGRAYTDWTRNLLIRLGWSNRPEWDDDGDLATPPADFPLEANPDGVPALVWSATVPPGYADWDGYLRPDLSLLVLLGRGHLHNEEAWSQRFPAALRFLFPPR